ncbi:MAG: YIP1 family protein [Fibrobacteres bacterium]|nr:YIP1 family protein [Fibrobacterota bacterium]
MIHCPFCKTDNNDDSQICVHCGVRLVDAAENVHLANKTTENKPEMKDGPDFEHNGPWNISSFFITLRQVLFQPAKTLMHLDVNVSLFNAIVYALAGGMIGSIFGGLWQYLASSTGWWESSGAEMFYGTFFGLAALWFMSPFIILLSLIVVSAIAHLFLRFTGETRPFAITLKVFAYSQGSSSPLGIVPFCGSVASFVWALICSVSGLAAAHKVSTGRSLFAVFGPLLICCACIVVAVSMAISLGLMAALSQMDGMGFLKEFVK